MKTDWVSILATVIFVSIVITMILAVLSYFAYKVRETRRPKTAAELRDEGQQKVFFEPYQQPNAEQPQPYQPQAK